MSKKKSIPLPFRILRSTLPVLESIHPHLSAKVGYRLFFRPLPYRLKQDEIQLRAQAKQEYIKCSFGSIVCYSWNSNKNTSSTSVLFMHGWAGHGVQSVQLLKNLIAKGYSVYSLDAPGHGQSKGKRTHLMQFKESILEFQKHVGQFDIAIGHSLGSAATAAAMLDGLNVKQYISISAPVIASEILAEFAKQINVSSKTTEKMDQMLENEFGNNFEYFSLNRIAREIQNIPTLIIHDKNDKQVSLKNPQLLKEILPHANCVLTESLGHSKILNAEKTIETVISFISKN